MQYNSDGSLDIYIQQSPPTTAKGLANWLPVAGQQFYLIVRSYGPGPGILDSSRIPPGIQVAQ